MPTYLWTALAVAAVWTLWLFIYWPRRIFPPSQSSKREEIVADIKARNDLRMTIAQFLAGGAFVVTFISSTTNFNRDIRQRTDAALAQDYSRAIAQIGNSENKRWQTIGSLYLLVKIAKQDQEYHQPVFSTIGRYLVPPAQTGCTDGSDQTSSYTILPELDIAARIYGERNLDLEASGEPRRNLDSICLSDAQLSGVQGFRGAWMRKARLFRVDLRFSNLQNADLREARAGVIHVNTWRSVRDEYPDPLVNPVSELIK